MTTRRSVVVGCGSYLPENVLRNAQLARQVDTSDAWIVQRTGIECRHIAANGEYTSDLALAAARRALQDAGLDGSDLDLIILATATPDHTFPATAVDVQHRLGMQRGAAFDIQAVCSGFVFALTSADMYIRCGQADRVLVIGAETFSRILDWKDRTTCVLFGDGAGALVLEASDDHQGRGILASCLRSDGAHKCKLFVDGGPSTTQTAGLLRMQGREVFRHAVSMITDVIVDVCKAENISPNDIDWFVPHQANIRIIDASARKLGIAAEKVVTCVQAHGNTSAASIPLALDVAVKDGRIKPGDRVLLEAMGGGFTWGATLLRW